MRLAQAYMYAYIMYHDKKCPIKAKFDLAKLE